MKNRVIYVEGPDCTGKSTLIEAIKREGDLIIHNGVFPTPVDAYNAYIDQLNQFVMQDQFERLILDRGVLSEIVYGQAIRQQKPDLVLVKTIIEQLQEMDYDIIVCLPPFGQTVIKWAKRLDTEYVKQFEEYVVVWEMFQSLTKEVDGVMVHDYTSNHQEVIDHVNR